MTPSAGQSGSTNHRALPSSVLFCKFIQSIPDNQLVRQKLNCMTKIVESNLFQQLGKLLLFMEIPVSQLLQIHLPFFFFFLNVNNILASYFLELQNLLGNQF